jgi:hypothetical protein
MPQPVERSKYLDSFIDVVDTVFGDPETDPFSTSPDEPEPAAGATGNDGAREYFSFSNCQSVLRTHSIEYYALFRNQGMNLEYLKSKKENVEPFVLPLVNCFYSRSVTNVVLAPRGDRYKKNGFHFVTELINRVKDVAEFELTVFEPFKKNKNEFEYNGAYVPPGAFLFDDIITRGTTIKNMASYVPDFSEIIVLICNH